MGPNMHWGFGISVELMICMSKPIFYMGKSVAMDSVFCVANGIVELAIKGVYTAL